MLLRLSLGTMHGLSYNRAKRGGRSFWPLYGQWWGLKQKAGNIKPHIHQLNIALLASLLDKLAQTTRAYCICGAGQIRRSILISESNAKGLGTVSYRTFDKATASQFTYVIGSKNRKGERWYMIKLLTYSLRMFKVVKTLSFADDRNYQVDDELLLNEIKRWRLTGWKNSSKGYL